MSAIATAIVGGVVVGGLASANAASQQRSASNKAVDATTAQQEQIREDNAPWRAAGQTALGSIGDLMGTSGNTGAANYGSLQHQFNASDLKSNLAPNYDFQLQQGLGAATNAGNAAGFSGNTLKGINDYAQGYAGNAYQQAFSNYTANQTNIYNRLSNLAGLGQTSNQISANAGTNLNGQAVGAMLGGANAQAAGTVGVGNAISNGLNNYAGWNYLSGGGYRPTANSPGGANSAGFGSGAGYGNEDLGANFSDVRLKTDIARIGTADSGLPIYQYRYKAGGPTQIGVMAQDVEQIAPEAVVMDRSGFKKVRYSMLKDIHALH